jgi:hypothetical protein
MKKHFLLFVVILSVSLSCTSKLPRKAADIDVSKLEEVCEFVDAIELCVDEILEIVKDRNYQDLNDDEIKNIEVLYAKLEEIDAVAQTKYQENEAQQCPNYERIIKKVESLN